MAVPTAVSPRAGSALVLLRTLRVHQWSKNVLIFAPAVLAHRLDLSVLARAVGAFLAFSLVASAAYVLNDLMDLEADRGHPHKRLRPIASGAVPLRAAWALAAVALAGGVLLAWSLPPAFAAVLAAYFAATLAYSTWLKRRVVADVLTLAGLYTVRLFAGAFAVGVPVSEWLATFAMFLFLSLALVKRASELILTGSELAGRGYRPEDRDVVLAMGTSSAFLAVLVLALYVSSHEVRQLYREPRWLWALCPLVLYWTGRIWIDTRRGLIENDPLVHALGMRVTWAVAAVGAAVLYLGT